MARKFGLFTMMFLFAISLYSQREVILLPCSGFDLDTDYSEHLGQKEGAKSDLVFCQGGGNEYLRAENGTRWAIPITNNYALGLDWIQKAEYNAPINQFSGYPDIFFEARGYGPDIGTVYYLRTSEGNYAIIRINNYITTDPNPQVCRQLIQE